MSDIQLTKKQLLSMNPRKLTNKAQMDTRKEVIATRKEALVNAIKLPPALNQFTNYLSEEDLKEVSDILSKFRPETRKERKQRLQNERKGPKPIIVKQGIKHVTKLIEEKKAKFVLIACDVDPIEVVLYLPTLCVKMGIPYALVKTKEDLGKIIKKKPTTCLCLCDVSSDIKSKFENVIAKCNGQFKDNYESAMKVWGSPKEKVKEE
ncbi:60S ribosomal protein L7A [Spraguea lophii 42_110]|uniref:60S ribosomal protein L8 n=1 Tax=Spraguea lophii (strain 42_110) TaxID=1358809 RepID=S7XU63_SPRLO|nr:Chain LG0, 60S ribosomal protein L8 [Spraguea lophii 42_110]7QJH_KG0 Chain KG0, 60S ribosomal protein L8 [Spraguea lophii 42_110]7QJH_LG0 Chain LG0, 60S ribosomal protein L8 [Spraguea lophii 42_110]8BR3_LG0 Chain LG0, 60S ribosomal protein L8 [Spraguea lophii 42_110]8P5D_LG0 Chain LG0, 60S ribosomal protein L8 [Spraguea lophii 42_110]8P60_KG0 Chain KG0, 60S ribosomal protein L8 [Spraguea lophii 42_110]8P60_LG0 Chain LG0, 60S ribosomal protein L8 [Spraguea lophii 42_110]EPR79458.1 60S ribo